MKTTNIVIIIFVILLITGLIYLAVNKGWLRNINKKLLKRENTNMPDIFYENDIVKYEEVDQRYTPNENFSFSNQEFLLDPSEYTIFYNSDNKLIIPRSTTLNNCIAGVATGCLPSNPITSGLYIQLGTPRWISKISLTMYDLPSDKTPVAGETGGTSLTTKIATFSANGLPLITRSKRSRITSVNTIGSTSLPRYDFDIQRKGVSRILLSEIDGTQLKLAKLEVYIITPPSEEATNVSMPYTLSNTFQTITPQKLNYYYTENNVNNYVVIKPKATSTSNNYFTYSTGNSLATADSATPNDLTINSSYIFTGGATDTYYFNYCIFPPELEVIKTVKGVKTRYPCFIDTTSSNILSDEIKQPLNRFKSIYDTLNGYYTTINGDTAYTTRAEYNIQYDANSGDTANISSTENPINVKINSLSNGLTSLTNYRNVSLDLTNTIPTIPSSLYGDTANNGGYTNSSTAISALNSFRTNCDNRSATLRLEKCYHELARFKALNNKNSFVTSFNNTSTATAASGIISSLSTYKSGLNTLKGSTSHSEFTSTSAVANDVKVSYTAEEKYINVLGTKYTRKMLNILLDDNRTNIDDAIVTWYTSNTEYDLPTLSSKLLLLTGEIPGTYNPNGTTNDLKLPYTFQENNNSYGTICTGIIAQRDALLGTNGFANGLTELDYDAPMEGITDTYTFAALNTKCTSQTGIIETIRVNIKSEIFKLKAAESIWGNSTLLGDTASYTDLSQVTPTAWDAAQPITYTNTGTTTREKNNKKFNLLDMLKFK